jgi:hypothetical protein
MYPDAEHVIAGSCRPLARDNVVVAVTQQLARLTDAQIALCAVDRVALERVCEFEELPEEDHADLDWAPSMLERAAERAELASHLIDALRSSTRGFRPVQPGYDGLYATYAPLTFLSSAETAAIAAGLGQIDISVMLTPAAVEHAMGGSGIENPREYLHEMFELLRDFYQDAARRRLGVILWWD